MNLSRFFALVVTLASISRLHAEPNIIFILTDDLGYGDLGVLFQNDKPGTKKLVTPQLDAMATAGTILNRHYCPAPVCAPSRGSLLTGLHQGHANVRDNQFDKALEDNHTIGSTLKEAGYYTAFIGKHGLQGSGSNPTEWNAYPTKRGFDYFYGYVRHGDGHTHYPDHVTSARGKKELWENNSEISADLDLCYTTDLFTARAKKTIIDRTQSAPDTPFFIYLSYDTPHAALQVPTMAYPAGGGLTGGLQWIGTPGNMINTATGTIDSYFDPLYTTQGWPEGHQRQATMVTRIDHCIGDLIKTLEDLEIEENTIIVFTSDHGPHSESYIPGVSYNSSAFQSSGPLEGEKRDVHEGGIRVPTLVWGPQNILAGQKVEQISQFHDWMSTFCDWAGVPEPARIDGVSLRPCLSGTGTQLDSTVYVEYSTSGSTPGYFPIHGGTSRNQAQVIYVDNYKGVRNNVTNHSQNFRIYDTETDLNESTNLAGTSSYFIELQQRMKDRVLQIRQPNGSASRPYDSEPAPSVLTSVAPGLVVQRHEGDWPWIPEFENLTELSSSQVSNLDVAHLSRNSDAGLFYQGFIQVPTDGLWSFTTESDAGVIMKIHDSLVIDDDFNHSSTSASGTMRLEAGLHPFRLYYRTEADAPLLTLSWSGPGTAQEPIPNSALFRQGVTPPEPNPSDDVASTIGTSPVSIPVLANDLDDGLPSALSISSFTQPDLGTVTQSGNELIYTPEAGKFGTASFQYTVTDGEFLATASVSVVITVPVTDLWMPLNEISGSTVSEAGGQVLGSLTGFGDPNAAHVPARHGYGLIFNGVDEQVNLSKLSLPTGGSARTISAWIKVPTTSPPEFQSFFSYGQNNNGQRITCRVNAANGELRLEVQGGFIIGTTSLNDNQWHHVAIRISDRDLNESTNVDETDLFVDGVKETISSSGSRTINTNGGTSAEIGGAGFGANYNFIGTVDELRVYSSAISDQAIQDLAEDEDSTFDAWAYRFFGPSAPLGNTDSDFDGIPLFAEFAFGTDPHRRDLAVPHPSVPVASSEPSFTYARRTTGTHRLTYTVEVSDDLVEWDLPFSETVLTPHPTLGEAFEEVSVLPVIESGEDRRRFMRVQLDSAE